MKSSLSLAETRRRSWEEGYRTIKENYGVFSHFLSIAQSYLHHRDYCAAALFAEIAAYSATWKHAGFFANREVEDLLLAIGRMGLEENRTATIKKPLDPARPKILHVASWVTGLQGLNRLLWRWIMCDSLRSHSLAVTGHELDKIPEILREAVVQSDGYIYALDETTGNILRRAKKLRELAASADLVVLHCQTEEVLPLIAFANKQCPVLFVNNADHAFWLGVSVSDLVINLRESGRRLSGERRGIVAERNVLLPTLIDRRNRIRDRNVAKKTLGLQSDTILLLSIARAPKYKSFDGVSYAQAHVPVLLKHKDAVLWVIGPEEDEDWRKAYETSGGRVRAFGYRWDTDIFYEAADVYVDSFPIVSITSLLEAGSYGLPLVSRYPYSDACRVLGADTPALDKCITRAKTLEEYQSVLSRLIGSRVLREQLGKQSRKAIEEMHFPENWLPILEDIYSRATRCSGLEQNIPPDKIYLCELDEKIPKLYGLEMSLDEFLFHRYLKQFPARDRMRLCLRLGVSHPYFISRRALTYGLRKLGMKDALRRLLRRLKMSRE